jgi:chromate reductase
VRGGENLSNRGGVSLVRILGICGSLRRVSSNASLLAAAQGLAPADMHIELYTALAELPYFNPDIDNDAPPAAVVELRRLIGRAQGVLICSPEYARGVAGVLKNALDWLVSCAEFPGKPVAVLNASQRATHADAALRITLTTMSACLVEAASITVPLMGRQLDASGITRDEELSRSVRAALESFRRSILELGQAAS